MNKRVKWTQEEIEKLKLIAPQSSLKELQEVFKDKTLQSIRARLFVQKIKLKPNKWSQKDIDFLHANFGKISSKELAEKLNRNEHAICEYARRRGLKLENFKDENGKTINRRDAPTLRRLLEETSQAYYWIGYLMADGYMHDGLGQIVLVSDIKDKEHLDKFAEFLNTTVKVYKHKSNKGSFRKENGFQARVSVAEVSICKKIKDKFDWKIQKTYYPPDVNILENILDTDEKFFSFLIGFIDGDGNIGANYSHIKIENHASWEEIHNFFLDKFRKLGMLKSDKKAIIGKRGYSTIAFGKQITLFLKDFITKQSLTVLQRKWFKKTSK